VGRKRSEEGEALIERWSSWVDELTDHPLDDYEYLGALVQRDEVELWLQISGDQAMMDAASTIDAEFEEITIEDSRFAEHFSTQAGTGWWWSRLPKAPESLRYITQGW
jgi:hypothetical protein